jgi:outer membrane lipoprotein-sorting protein
MNNPCEKKQDKIADYVLGILRQEEIDALDKHINQCPRCREYTESLQSEKRSLLQFGKTLDSEMDARQDKVIEALNQVSIKKAKLLSIWRIIMKSPITKLATAAAITIAIIISIKGFNGTTAWADVIKAIKNADNIHILSKITKPNGLVIESHAWLKNRTMIYDEDPPDEITIDDGVNRLTLDTEKMTAQLSDSYSPFEDYMETGNFEIILLFRGEDTPFRATELPDERTSTMRVYEVTYRDVWKGKAWVDAESNLPVRITADFAERFKQRVLSLEVIYDYQAIPVEKFSLTIPAGYTELARLRSQLFSGKVIDEKGEGVAGADIYTSDTDRVIRDKTDEKGEFAIKLRPRSLLSGFPMIVRAFKSNNPNRVAWTLLRNPRHELLPLSISDDGKTKLERGGDVTIIVADEKKLFEFIPGEPPNMIFKKITDSRPIEIRDIVLKMAPASVITGRITDRAGKPIANAVVWIERMAISVGENEIDIHNMGQTEKEKEMVSSLNIDDIREKSFAVTDKNGYYSLANLPNVWHRIRLEVKVDGYVTEAKEIFQEECDFTLLRADITIRGTVVDNHGQPLVGREVEIDIDSDNGRDFDIEEVIIDSEGRFELTGVPAANGLELQFRTDEKPRDWNRNELTQGHQFIYYRMIEEPIKFEPGKKDYWVEIVLHRPDISLEIEVKDSEGNLLEGIPVGICSSGFSERIWFTSKLNGKTDSNGICTIEEVPRIEPLILWICKPITRPEIWEIEREINMEVKNAITELSSKYNPTEVTVELEKEKKKYKIPVTLQVIEK